MYETLHHWIGEHGYVGLFTLLVLGIVGLPIPDETVLAYVGFQVSKGTMALVPTLLTAFVGSTCAITISYLLGLTAGEYLLKRFGSRLHFTPERIARVHGWFRHMGRWTLTFGYFVPGFRHLTAFVAGSSRLEYRLFAPFAYLGGMLWTSTFIALGYFFGEEWSKVAGSVRAAVLIAFGVISAGVLLFVVIRRRRQARRRPAAPPPSSTEGRTTPKNDGGTKP